VSCTSIVDHNIWHNNYVFHELPLSSPQETSTDESEESTYCEDTGDSEYSDAFLAEQKTRKAKDG